MDEKAIIASIKSHTAARYITMAAIERHWLKPAIEYLRETADALGYDLVPRESTADLQSDDKPDGKGPGVSPAPGFDGRDGGRMNIKSVGGDDR